MFELWLDNHVLQRTTGEDYNVEYNAQETTVCVNKPGATTAPVSA